MRGTTLIIFATLSACGAAHAIGPDAQMPSRKTTEDARNAEPVGSNTATTDDASTAPSSMAGTTWTHSCSGHAAATAVEAVALDKLFVHTSQGALMAVDFDAGTCEALLIDVEAIHGVGKQLFILQRRPDGREPLLALRDGAFTTRSVWPGSIEPRHVLSDVDEVPLVVESDRLWLERRGAWVETRFAERYPRPPNSVVGTRAGAYLGFGEYERGHVDYVDLGSGRVTSHRVGDGISSMVRDPSDPSCVFIGTRTGDLTPGGSVLRMCGAAAPVTFRTFAAPRPLPPSQSLQVHGLAASGPDVLALAGTIEIRSVTTRALVARVPEPKCICGLYVARATSTLFVIFPPQGDPLFASRSW